jgi:ankyrin repeat protein
MSQRSETRDGEGSIERVATGAAEAGAPEERIPKRHTAIPNERTTEGLTVIQKVATWRVLPSDTDQSLLHIGIFSVDFNTAAKSKKLFTVSQPRGVANNAVEVLDCALFLLPTEQLNPIGLPSINPQFQRRRSEIKQQNQKQTPAIKQQDQKQQFYRRSSEIKQQNQKQPPAIKQEQDQEQLSSIKYRDDMELVPENTPSVSTNEAQLQKILYEVKGTRRKYYVGILLCTPRRDPLPKVFLDCYLEENKKRIAHGTFELPRDEASDLNSARAMLWTEATGWESATEILLNKLADGSNMPYSEDRSLLSLAAERGHIQIVTHLLERDVYRSQINCGDRIGEMTPLLWAASNGHGMIVQTLLEHGANCNAVDFWLRSPLSQAAKNGHESIVQVLLDHEILVGGVEYLMDEEDRDGETPTSLAFKNSHVNTWQLLLVTGLKLSASGCRTSRRQSSFKEYYLLNAARSGWLELMECLVATDPIIDPETECALPLCEAVSNGHTAVVALLLQVGANCNTANKDDDPMLCLAAAAGYSTTVDVLLQAGADRDGRTKDGDTALYLAVEKQHVMVVRKLLDNGVNVEVPNGRGKMPKSLAEENDDDEILRMILKTLDEGRLAEGTGHGLDPTIDGNYHARIYSFKWEHDRMTYNPERTSIFNLLHTPEMDIDSSDSPHTVFRWIHLPANNVSWRL